MSHGSEILGLLDTAGCEHREACLAACHHILMVSEDGEGMGGKGPGGYMEDGGKHFTCNLVHVRNHEKETLRCSVCGCKDACLQGAVNSSGGSVQGSMTSGNVHTITSPNGTVIFNDSRIDTSDASTQAQIEDYLQNKGGYKAMNNFNNDVERAAYGKISFVPMGNTFVFCYTFNNISEYEKSSMKTYLTSTMFVSTLAQDRQVTGIPNLIEVFVMLNADGSVYYSRMVE